MGQKFLGLVGLVLLLSACANQNTDSYAESTDGNAAYSTVKPGANNDSPIWKYLKKAYMRKLSPY